MIEDELRAHYAATRVNPGAHGRVLSAVVKTKQRHRGRTGLAVSGSIAAVGALALVLVLIPRSNGGAAPAAAGSTAGAATTTVASTPTSPAIPTPEQLRPVTAQIVVQTLIDLVSTKGTAANPTGRALENAALGEIVFNDGHGAARMNVALTWKGTRPKDASPQACPPAPDCTVLSDGTTIETSQSLEYPGDPSHPNNSTEWSVQVYRPSDGFEVDISELNAPTAKDSPASRAEPPFTLAQLSTMATSPTWSATATASAIAAADGLFVPDVMPTG